MSEPGFGPGAPGASFVVRRGLSLQARLTLVVGKGGVGKTTIANALAVHAARNGRQTLVVSTDPAHSLADSLGVSVGSEPTAIIDRLWALQLNPQQSIAAFLERTRPALHAALDRGTYLDDADIDALIRLPLPGIDEVAALLELARLMEETSWTHIIVDTAPTGHTERLLGLPQVFARFGELLDAMQERYRFMVARLARGVPRRRQPDPVDALIAEFRSDAAGLQRQLHDESTTQVILVGTPEPVVLSETLRYLDWLRDDALPLAAVVLNRIHACRACRVGGQAAGALDRLREAAAPVPIFLTPEFRRPPQGPRRLRRVGALLAGGGCPLGVLGAEGQRGRGAEGRDEPLSPLSCAPWSSCPFPLAQVPLQLVVGKGGVGKTTVAAANALSLAEEDGPVLLVSLDPAHSLGDVWATPVGDAPVEVAARLWALEVDARSRWDRLRPQWQDALASAADDAERARIPGWRDTLADIERLLDLVPPGVDEVVGLFALGELWEGGAYRAIVVDCAPTGHLLQLLRLPELALEWVRMLMRLLLKYKEIVGLDALAEELIGM